MNETYGNTPLCGAFGAEVSGLRLDSSLSRADVRHIVDLLFQYQILLFRGQKLGPAQQVLLSRGLGTVETHRFHPGQLVDYPEIFRISNSSGDGHTSVGHYWHSDGFSFADPTQVFMLNSVETPSVGGQTLFVDGYGAWNTLPIDLREQIQKARWKHQSGVWHSFYRRHFQTGRCSLLVNLGRIADVEGPDSLPAASLTSRLVDHLCGCCAPYTHCWQDGDVILTDNWSVVHRAQPAPSPFRRVVHRSSVLKLHSFLTKH